MPRFPARLRRYRALLWCLALSLVLHAVLLPFVEGLFGLHRFFDQPPEEVVYRTSTLEIAPRPRPIPRAVPHAHPHVQPPARPVAAAIPEKSVARPVQIEHRELARITPRAHINVPRVTAVDSADQQAQYEKTIARLREQSSPLEGVADAAPPAPATPGPAKHFAFDFAGMGASPHAEGVLTPIKSWKDGPYTYYYVRYWAEYPDGTTETGVVPWPLRYLPKSDPFLRHWEHFPLPVPLADFALPSGTDLHPLVAFCYAHRDEFNSCPIEHD